MYGAYADSCDMRPSAAWRQRGATTCAARDFMRYLASAHRHEALPSWWLLNREAQDRLCMKAGKKMIGYAVEKSDIKDEYGPMAPMILRALAERVTGCSVMGGSQYDDNEGASGRRLLLGAFDAADEKEQQGGEEEEEDDEGWEEEEEEEHAPAQ